MAKSNVLLFIAATVIVVILFMLFNRGSNAHLETLEYIYDTYDGGFGLHHWHQFAKHYDRHIHHIRENAIKNKRTVKMLELGVQSGGSTRVWKRYFGEATRYVGIDINPNCREAEAENIHIEIGSQEDALFLANICLRHGPFDFIVDDGGHTTRMIMTSLRVLWWCLNDGGVYAIEDLHSMSMWSPDRDGMMVEGKDAYGHLGDLSRAMTQYFQEREGVMLRREKWMDPMSSHIDELSIYDSLAFLHFKKTPEMLIHFKKGDHWISDKW
jgi:hypothetical protein